MVLSPPHLYLEHVTSRFHIQLYSVFEKPLETLQKDYKSTLWACILFRTFNLSVNPPQTTVPTTIEIDSMLFQKDFKAPNLSAIFNQIFLLISETFLIGFWRPKLESERDA